MEEYKIGDIVDIDGIKYIVKEEIEEGCCIGCAFYDQIPERCREVDGKVYGVINIDYNSKYERSIYQ